MKGVGVEIHLARVKHEVMALLEKDGVDQNIGRDHIHNKVFEAVQLLTRKEKHISENDLQLYYDIFIFASAPIHNRLI